MPINPCCCGSPIPTCTACGSLRYRIAGYIDGDLTPDPLSLTCAAAYIIAGSPTCNGVAGLGATWDGTFPVIHSAIGSGVPCFWKGTCNNLASGVNVNGNSCVSNVLAVDFSIRLSCSFGAIVKKEIIIIYSKDGSTQSTLWQGQNTTDLSDGSMAVIYTRTGGDSATPATFTAETY